MGLNITFETKDGEEHPEWDWIRQGDDRENARRLTKDSVSWVPDGFPFEDDKVLLRPTETTELIGSRGKEMMDIFNSDPKWWVCLSY